MHCDMSFCWQSLISLNITINWATVLCFWFLSCSNQEEPLVIPTIKYQTERQVYLSIPCPDWHYVVSAIFQKSGKIHHMSVTFQILFDHTEKIQPKTQTEWTKSCLWKHGSFHNSHNLSHKYLSIFFAFHLLESPSMTHRIQWSGGGGLEQGMCQY